MIFMTLNYPEIYESSKLLGFAKLFIAKLFKLVLSGLGMDYSNKFKKLIL